MGQINIGKQNVHNTPPSGACAYTFNSDGKPGYIDSSGVFTLLGESGTSTTNLYASLGVGLSSELPGSPSIGDTFVTTDTLQLYTRIDSVSWSFVDLPDNAFVTDLTGTYPALYQVIGTSMVLLVFREFTFSHVADDTTEIGKELLANDFVFDIEKSIIYQLLEKAAATDTLSTLNKQVVADGLKLDGIESGAQVNVNADWDSVSGDSEILNKPSDVTDLSTHASSELSDGADLVKGPASATDNTLPRFDLNTGKLLQAGGSITNLDNGNVGIGTGTPVGKLDVSAGILYTRNGLAGTDREQIRIGRSDNDIRYHSIHSYHAGDANRNYLKFKVHDGGTDPFLTQTNVMTLLGNGNVGIGTETPSEKLHVIGNIAVSGTVDGRDVAVDGAKLDKLSGYVTSNFAGKIAKTLDVNTLNAEVTLFTVPSGTMCKCGNMADGSCKIYIFGTKTGMNDDAVVDVTFNNFVGTARARTFTLNTLGRDPYVFVCDLEDQKIGVGDVKVKVTTAGTGTNGDVIITTDAVW